MQLIGLIRNKKKEKETITEYSCILRDKMKCWLTSSSRLFKDNDWSEEEKKRRSLSSWNSNRSKGGTYLSMCHFRMMMIIIIILWHTVQWHLWTSKRGWLKRKTRRREFMWINQFVCVCVFQEVKQLDQIKPVKSPDIFHIQWLQRIVRR